MARGRTHRVLLAGLAVAAGMGLAACGDNGYEYVSNSDAGLYFRVPDSWAVLPVQTGDTGRPEAVGDPADSWARLIDRSPNPGPANFESPVPSYPVGIAVVETVPDLDTRDALDLASLRALANNGTDPFAEAQNEGTNLQLVDLYDVDTADDVRGQRVVFTIHRDDGTYVTYDQTALVDNRTTELFRLLVKCESTCYERNRDEIDDIADSWTVDLED